MIDRQRPRRMVALIAIAVLVSGLTAWWPTMAASQSSMSGTLAWLWSNEPETDSYSPDARYQFNSSGAENTVTRTGVGEYTASFPGVGQETGVFHVTGQGDAMSCTLARWDLVGGADLNIKVRCFGTDGAPIDSGFSVMYYIPEGDRIGGYLLANEPQSDSYTPNNRYSYNSSGVENSVSRSGVGEYTASFPGVGVEAGGFQVTGHGGAMSCTIANWVLIGEDMDVNVRCVSADGAAIDSGFLVSYNIVH